MSVCKIAIIRIDVINNMVQEACFLTYHALLCYKLFLLWQKDDSPKYILVSLNEFCCLKRILSKSVKEQQIQQMCIFKILK